MRDFQHVLPVALGHMGHAACFIGTDWAFRRCVNLENINLPENLKEIKGCAFYDCFLLNSINLPKSLKNIGWYAFTNCISLADIYLHTPSFQPENIGERGVFSSYPVYIDNVLYDINIFDTATLHTVHNSDIASSAPWSSFTTVIPDLDIITVDASGLTLEPLAQQSR